MEFLIYIYIYFTITSLSLILNEDVILRGKCQWITFSGMVSHHLGHILNWPTKLTLSLGSFPGETTGSSKNYS